jgi:hypothetical protein
MILWLMNCLRSFKVEWELLFPVGDWLVPYPGPDNWALSPEPGSTSSCVRRLQLGDPGGHVRRALDFFPLREVAERIVDRYYVPGGKPADQPFRSKPMLAVNPSRLAEELLVAANFVEIFLAKEGHDGQVGINYLEKIQLPTVPSLYGAMLAGCFLGADGRRDTQVHSGFDGPLVPAANRPR